MSIFLGFSHSSIHLILCIQADNKPYIESRILSSWQKLLNLALEISISLRRQPGVLFKVADQVTLAIETTAKRNIGQG